MAGLLDLDWLFFAAGGLLGVAALWLMWRGLLADRSRGRARCPKCWYDLAALLPFPVREGRSEGSSRGEFSPVTCPECGRMVKRERQLHRTRRRWWVALAGMVTLVFAGVVSLTPKVRRDGVWSITPTWAMIGIAHVVDRSRWPGLDREMRERLFAAGISDAAIRQLFLTDRSAVRFRAKWPRGVPLVLQGGGVGSSDGFSHAVLAIGNKAFPEDFYPRVPDGFWDFSYEENWLDPGLVVGDVESARNCTIWVWPETVRASVPVRLPIEVCDSLDEAITPVRGVAVDNLVRESLQLRFAQMPTSKRPYLATRSIDAPELQGIVIAPRVEIRDGDRVIASVAWWQSAGRDKRLNGLPILMEGETAQFEALMLDPTNSRYTVRVRGDGEMALRDFDGKRYWAGEFTMPLSELIRPPATVPAADHSP